ncbi:MAG: AraC family transcriptional regulator [Pseudobutyrivibrio sp.]|nr:AraC family transcriptional regulator [Pseudobutyrivibrio sp.]
MLQNIIFPVNQIFKYQLTGKFQALSPEWKHDHAALVDYELIIVTEGDLYLSYQGQNFHVSKNEYLILPPSNTYREGYKEAYSSFYWMHFLVELGSLPPTLNSSYTPNQQLTESFLIPQQGALPRPEKVIVQMKQLQDIVKNNYPQISLDSMTTSIITELYGQLQVRPARTKNKLHLQQQIYNDIVDYIETNIHMNLKVQDVADAFNYNPKYLSHLFYELYGMPLKQFILDRKIETANFMLADNDKQIKEIANDLGFSDVHNFTRAYKKRTGITPTEYRNAFSKRLLFYK